MTEALHPSTRPWRRLHWVAFLGCLGAYGAPSLAQVAAESAAVRAGAAAATTAIRPAVPVPSAGVPATAGAAGGAVVSPSVASAIPADTGPSCAQGLPEPTRVRLSAGKATLINLPEAITRRTLGDPLIAEGRMVSPQVLYLVAGRVGATNAILQGMSGRCTVLEIVVALDVDAIQAKIAELLPGEKGIRVTAAADSVVLNGVASHAVAVEHAVSIANAYVRAAYQQGMTANATPRAGQQNAVDGAAPQSARVVNLLSVSSNQQVMLEVKIAEVAKTVIEKLGASVNATRTNGSWTYQLLSNFLTGTTGAIGGASQNALKNVLLEAEKKDGMVRILAEPNVIAVSGQEGSFLAGGKILIPVAQNNTLSGLTITLEEKEFGVGLKFTPTVLGDGRINLKVAPEVSELSREGVGISTISSSGTAVLPLITTRRATTTVQLYDGQSFAIGGLIKNSQAANLKALPVLGEIPVIGALFRSNDFQQDKTELVFVVTPRLVRPLPPDYRLPTDRVGEATREGVFLEGRLDGPGTPARPSGTVTPPASGGGLQVR